MDPNANGQPRNQRRQFGAALRANQDYIKLPRTFYGQFGNELGNKVSLEDENTGMCFTTIAQVVRGHPYFIGGIEDIRQFYLIPVGAIVWFRYIGRGNFKMKIPMNNKPLDPLPWDRIRVDPYPPGYDDTTSDEDDISSNFVDEVAIGDVSESPVPSPTITSESHGPHQGSEGQVEPNVNGPHGSVEDQFLWTNKISDASSTGKQALVIPAKVWRQLFQRTEKSFQVMMDDGSIHTWSIIWTPNQCRVGHGWYEFCKACGCVKNDKLIFWKKEGETYIRLTLERT